MKRSEMEQKLLDYLDGIRGYEPDHRYMVKRILDIIEVNGMLPPHYITDEPATHIKFIDNQSVGVKVFHRWEKE